MEVPLDGAEDPRRQSADGDGGEGLISGLSINEMSKNIYLKDTTKTEDLRELADVN